MEQIKKYIKRGLQLMLPGNLPDFLIIGAQKAGTSSLHYYLSQHPRLAPSQQKEIHFFNRLVHHGYDLDWYRNQFITRSFRRQLHFESSPSYIYQDQVAERISAHLPQIKLILILREPVSRAYSAWNMYRDFFENDEVNKIRKERIPGRENPIYAHLFKERKTFPGFLEAMVIEKELMAGSGESEPSIFRRGLYAEQIREYWHYFDRDRLLILGFEEFIRDIPSTIQKVTSFLEVEPIDAGSLVMEKRNARSYQRKITREERDQAQRFYEQPNKELFDLLGYKPEW